MDFAHRAEPPRPACTSRSDVRRRLAVCGVLAVLVTTGVSAAPRRIVSVSPAVTEMLYGIGAFDYVVAVTEYCTYPPQAKRLPKIGGWATPSVEKIVAFQPDLVAYTDSQAPFLEGPLAKLGIHTVTARGQTIQDALLAMAALGKATGNEQQATQLIQSVKTALERVRTRAAPLPHPPVLCIVDRTPGTLRDLYAAVQGSFLAELIEIAGGAVVGGASRGGYGRINKEEVLRANPQVVLDLMAQMNAAAHPESAWLEMPELDAVRHGRIHIVHEDFATHNSQRIAETVVLFARLLHPEVPPREWEAH
ncbi:MAG: hypothetical protein C5B51_29765 [Terriglobia bacterium]|nr:MAG: hypothetical protein C5B51_29765 [Terriglobia bacterium]